MSNLFLKYCFFFNFTTFIHFFVHICIHISELIVTNVLRFSKQQVKLKLKE